MNARGAVTAGALLCGAALALLPPAPALERGLTTQNRPYVSGGISREEQVELEAMQRRYTLWLLTADERSGAWLSDAAVEIRDARSDVVLAVRMDGPYLLVDLEPGRYRLLVTLGGETRALAVEVSRAAVRRVVVRFATGADVLPDPRERMNDKTALASAWSRRVTRSRQHGNAVCLRRPLRSARGLCSFLASGVRPPDDA